MKQLCKNFASKLRNILCFYNIFQVALGTSSETSGAFKRSKFRTHGRYCLTVASKFQRQIQNTTTQRHVAHGALPLVGFKQDNSTTCGPWGFATLFMYFFKLNDILEFKQDNATWDFATLWRLFQLNYTWPMVLCHGRIIFFLETWPLGLCHIVQCFSWTEPYNTWPWDFATFFSSSTTVTQQRVARGVLPLNICHFPEQNQFSFLWVFLLNLREVIFWCGTKISIKMNIQVYLQFGASSKKKICECFPFLQTSWKLSNFKVDNSLLLVLNKNLVLWSMLIQESSSKKNRKRKRYHNHWFYPKNWHNGSYLIARTFSSAMVPWKVHWYTARSRAPTPFLTARAVFHGESIEFFWRPGCIRKNSIPPVQYENRSPSPNFAAKDAKAMFMKITFCVIHDQVNPRYS